MADVTDYRNGTCKKCGAETRWGHTAVGGKRIELDLEPISVARFDFKKRGGKVAVFKAYTIHANTCKAGKGYFNEKPLWGEL